MEKNVLLVQLVNIQIQTQQHHVLHVQQKHIKIRKEQLTVKIVQSV